MELFVDCGNSRLKWVQWQDGCLREQSSLPLAKDFSIADLKQHWLGMNRPRRVLMANVAGKIIVSQISNWCEQNWGMLPEILRTKARGYGVVNGYRKPETLGVDRWLTLIATRYHYPLPACIVDCGTALTLDVLESNGRHRGGVICPGLNLMGQALLERAPGIQATMAEQCLNEILADNTAVALQIGALQALAGFLERMHEQLPKLHWIITGGDAAKIKQELNFPVQWVPDLLWKGMIIVSQNNEFNQ